MTRCTAIVIPTLDEEVGIGGLLTQLSRLSPAEARHILVADGGSRDGTRAVVIDAGLRDARIRLVDNPARVQAAGVNRAVAQVDMAVDTIVRIDAHARYADDYVPRLIATMARTGADMVAVRLDTQGDACLQRGIAAAANSPAGSGGSAHRSGSVSGFVDHGHHAAMDRRLFDAVGGYDESFAANEDAELDVRIRRAGGRIWLAADIVVTYFPRTTLAALFRQYRRYGRGRARTFLKHGERLRLRQLLPPAVVATVAGAIILAPIWPPLLLLPATYAGGVCAAVAVLWVRSRRVCTLAAAPAMVTMHLAWGLGFLATLAGGRERDARP